MSPGVDRVCRCPVARSNTSRPTCPSAKVASEIRSKARTPLTSARVQDDVARIAELYTTKEVDAGYAIYNEFKNVLVQKLRSEKLLRLDPAVFEPEAGERKRETAGHGAPKESLPVTPSPSGALLVEYIYEEPIAQIFNGLVPRYLEAEVFRILLESAAAEHAARMTAMDSATRNASELIEKLTLQMNKIRQAAITKELIEVVSGAASAMG